MPAARAARTGGEVHRVLQPETRTLLQRIAAGDAEAMAAMMDEYRGLVWSLARKLCPTPSDAEDGVQDVFIELWSSAGRFDPTKGTEVTFVATIARRRLTDRIRRWQRRQRLVTDVAQATRPPEAGPVPIGPAPDEIAAASEAMERLSDEQRRVLTLAIARDCTHEEIARITDLPLGTVKTHARRGLMRVRELLQRARPAGGAATP
jgi:RNA polymerase sigma-70 factor (ECF subfamily)